nr:hypothetical protein Iba_chr13eCG11290 [Ipomoea batatas]
MAYGWRRMKRKRRLDFSLKMRWRSEPATSMMKARHRDEWRERSLLGEHCKIETKRIDYVNLQVHAYKALYERGKLAMAVVTAHIQCIPAVREGYLALLVLKKLRVDHHYQKCQSLMVLRKPMVAPSYHRGYEQEYRIETPHAER